MALIACGECGHEISTQAASCPNCGAPTARAAGRERTGPKALQRTLIALAALAVVGAALWLSAGKNGPLAETFARWRTERWASRPNPAPAMVPPSPAAPKSAGNSAAAEAPVYVTTAELLYHDYRANAIATRSRIGGARVRVTGSVTEIDEDLADHPVVKLGSGGAESTAMLLKDDQKGAAAQLIKGESVGIQCDTIQRDPAPHSGAPQGSGCVLVQIDAAANPVYLAVSSANGKQKSLVYIVGPMPESDCRSHADMISGELSGNFDREDVIAKRCSPTARENVPATGCRLSASMPALPDMPETHLWRYDCATAAAPRKVVEGRTAARKSQPKRVALSEESVESTAAAPPLPPVPDLPGEGPESSLASAPVITAFQSTPAATTTGVASNSTTDSAGGIARPAAASGMVSLASQAGSAVAGSVATGSPVPADNVTPSAKDSANPATAAPQTPSSSATPPLPADLAAVKASDPTAADRIASYCDRATAAARDHASVAANCRHDEEAAWTRLVVNNEFPALDEATRRKCNEAPFPDSYVAKESCAKYQLKAK